MASPREIRKRISSVKNIQKITGAMKLVAASKLRRAQEAILSVRPYAADLGGLLHRLATRSDDAGEGAAHPLLELRPVRRALLVVITSDRGLCGGFNGNILRRAERFIAEQGPRFDKLDIATIGRKGRDYMQKRKLATVRDFPGVFEDLGYHQASGITSELCRQYLASELDSVFLLYNEYKSALAQKVVIESVLPVAHEELPVGADTDYLYEPDREHVLDRLVPRYVATIVWRALLESTASEHGARMTAMGAAQKNARDLVGSLTLQFNRTRQACITRELMEIVGGAEALKG